MKTKYFFAVLCCVVMVACNSNDPEQSDGQTTVPVENEFVTNLKQLYDGIGTIVSTDSLSNGSVEMKDNKGNVIIKDKDGNITIVTPKNETISIDNSINENPKAPKDKWYKSTWRAGSWQRAEPSEPLPALPRLIEMAKYYGFHIAEQSISKDSTRVEQGQRTYFKAHFLNTTVSLQQIDSTLQNTTVKTLQYTKYTFTPDSIDLGEEKYVLAIENHCAVLYYKVYESVYNDVKEEYEYQQIGREIVDMLELQNDDTYIHYEGYEFKESKEEVVSARTQTTYYNYRRLSEKQLVASNNSDQYMVKEQSNNEGSETPILEVYELNGTRCLFALSLESYK